MFRLDGLNALVTGATGGIGGAIAKALHSIGASVVLSGTKVDVLENLARSMGERVHVTPCDLKQSEQVESLFSVAEEKAGQIDILVNNAGLTRDNLILRMKDDEWHDVINVNLTSSFRLARAASKSMMRRRFGRIINISSVVAAAGNVAQSNYCASKAGLIGMSKSLATELASRGITVNCVAPGFIDTNMTAGLSDPIKETLMRNIPMGRMGTGDEIASAVCFLASKEASYMTGQTIHINGGMYMA